MAVTCNDMANGKLSVSIGPSFRSSSRFLPLLTMDQHLWEGLMDHRVVQLKLAWKRSLFQSRGISWGIHGILNILCRVESPSSQPAITIINGTHDFVAFFPLQLSTTLTLGCSWEGGAYNLHIAPSSSRKSWQNTFLILAGLKMICRQFCRTVRR